MSHDGCLSALVMETIWSDRLSHISAILSHSASGIMVLKQAQGLMLLPPNRSYILSRWLVYISLLDKWERNRRSIESSLSISHFMYVDRQCRWWYAWREVRLLRAVVIQRAIECVPSKHFVAGFESPSPFLLLKEGQVDTFRSWHWSGKYNRLINGCEPKGIGENPWAVMFRCVWFTNLSRNNGFGVAQSALITLKQQFIVLIGLWLTDHIDSFSDDPKISVVASQLRGWFPFTSGWEADLRSGFRHFHEAGFHALADYHGWLSGAVEGWDYLGLDRRLGAGDKLVLTRAEVLLFNQFGDTDETINR